VNLKEAYQNLQNHCKCKAKGNYNLPNNVSIAQEKTLV